jgi:hypothetical protein
MEAKDSCIDQRRVSIDTLSSSNSAPSGLFDALFMQSICKAVASPLFPCLRPSFSPVAGLLSLAGEVALSCVLSCTNTKQIQMKGGSQMDIKVTCICRTSMLLRRRSQMIKGAGRYSRKRYLQVAALTHTPLVHGGWAFRLI